MVNEIRNAFSFDGWRARFLLCLVIFSGYGSLTGQQTVLYRNAESDFFDLVKQYDQGLYGRCIRSAEKYKAVYKEVEFEQFVIEAELYQLKAGLNIDNPGIINQIFAFSEEHKPDAVAEKAILMIGEDAYDRREYEEAIKYLSMVNGNALQPEEQSALYFKLGYVLFVRKEFDRAADLFNETRNIRDKYYYPCNYYYGMTQY